MIQQILKALYGTYVPTGMYSFEFRERSGKSFRRIAEIFLLLPPETVQVNETQRAALQPTLTGNYISDYGNEVKDITISGTLYYYYAGSVSHPLERLPNARSADLVDGFSEFMKLRFLIIRYRDYTMTGRRRLYAPDFPGIGLAAVQQFKERIKDHIGSGEGALAKKIEIVFHDYDDDNHFKVKVDSFQASRDKGDPFSVKYSIQLKAYQVDGGGVTLPSVESIKKTTAEQVDATALLLASVNTEIPDKLKSDLNLYLLDQKITRAKSYLEWANNIIKSGIMSPNRALTKQTDTFTEGEMTVSDNIVTLNQG